MDRKCNHLESLLSWSIVERWFAFVQSAGRDLFAVSEEEKPTEKDVSCEGCSLISDKGVSPFLPYENGYRWPDLWSELDEMMEGLAVVYPLVQIRGEAQEKEENIDVLSESVLKNPLTMQKALDTVLANKNKIVEASSENDLVLKSIEVAEKRVGLLSSSIVSIDVPFEQQELAYAIQLNHQRQRITIFFMGPRTMEFARQMEVYFKEIDNPLKKHRTQEDTLCVHNLVHDLATSVGGNSNVEVREKLSYFAYVLKQLLPVMNEHPRYKLYVSGHSFGAALATLFAFHAAVQPDSIIPKPVSLFTFGSPYVGDYAFRSAHQLLESHGKLRHLRLSNHQDIVTLSPKVSMRLKFYDRSSHVGSLFKHVGVNMKLYSKDSATPIEISYPKIRSGLVTNALDEVNRALHQSLLLNWAWNPADYIYFESHDLKSYDERIWVNRPTLQAISLNDLYSRKEIVGNLIAEF